MTNVSVEICSILSCVAFIHYYVCFVECIIIIIIIVDIEIDNNYYAL